MKRSDLLIILVLSMFLPVVAQDSYQYTAPEFMQCIYDQYSRNYLNINAMGRGHTGAAFNEGIENATINPAGFTTDKFMVHMEFFQKGNATEMNETEFRQKVPENSDTRSRQTYQSTNPFAYLGIGFSPLEHLSLGLSYSMDQSLEYTEFTREMKDDTFYSLTPSYAQSRLSLATSYAIKTLRLGMNIHYCIYTLDDYRYYYNLNRTDVTETTFRFQPGIQYDYKFVSAGVSYMPKTELAFDLDNGEEYDVTFPSVLTAGLLFRIKDIRVAGDIEYEKCSEQSDMFDDRLRMKFGLEYDYLTATLRVGYMQVPGVYTGYYEYPKGEFSASQHEDYFPADSHDTGYIDENDQAFLTGGFTIKTFLADISFGLMSDIAGDVPVTMGMLGITIDSERLGKPRRK